MNKLVHIVDEFIEGKNAIWNHEDWLDLVENVNKSGININENDLGEFLETEKNVFLAKKQGLKIVSKSK